MCPEASKPRRDRKTLSLPNLLLLPNEPFEPLYERENGWLRPVGAGGENGGGPPLMPPSATIGVRWPFRRGVLAPLAMEEATLEMKSPIKFEHKGSLRATTRGLLTAVSRGT